MELSPKPLNPARVGLLRELQGCGFLKLLNQEIVCSWAGRACESGAAKDFATSASEAAGRMPWRGLSPAKSRGFWKAGDRDGGTLEAFLPESVSAGDGPKIGWVSIRLSDKEPRNIIYFVDAPCTRLH